MANKTINQITNVSTNAQDNDLLMMWDNAREKTVKIKNKDFNKHNQPKTLETPIEVDNVEETTVEGALGGLNTEVSRVTNYTIHNNVDLNNFTKTGLYYLTNGLTNAPHAYIMLQVVSRDNITSTGSIIQTAISLATNQFYTRVRDSGTWSSWQELVTLDSIKIKSRHSYTESTNVTLDVSDLNIGQYYALKVTFNGFGDSGTFEELYVNSGNNMLTLAASIVSKSANVTVSGTWSGDKLTGITVTNTKNIYTYSIKVEAF